MDLAQARRYARHVALPEVGPEGQQRILSAQIALVHAPAGDLALETAALYLGFAGVGRFVLLADVPPTWWLRLEAALPLATFAHRPRPTSGHAWTLALAGVTCAVRADFGDDSFVEACRQLGTPAVVTRHASSGGPEDDGHLDLLSLRPEAPQAPPQVPSVPPSPLAGEPSTALERAAQVLAGTLAATEALWLVCGRPPQAHGEPKGAHMRHFRWPTGTSLTSSATYNVPWTPHLDTKR